MKLALAGDTMLGRGVAERLASGSPESLFAPEVVAAVGEADLCILNLECCISERGAPVPGKVFHFRAPVAAAETLTHLGVDCVTLANNHALDFGTVALADTLDLLHAAGIETVGAGTDLDQARQPAVLEANGVRLGVIGVTDHPPDYAAGSRRPGAAFARLGWQPEEWVAVGQQLEAARLRYGADPSWALENHDLVRTATRFGGGERGARRSRSALLALLGLPGALYVYQGQELGLPEVDVPEATRVDPMWSRGGVSRDGARIPLPWTSGANGTHGFSPNAAAPAWLPVPADWGSWSIENQQGNEESAYSAFTRATELRAGLLASGVFRPGEGALWRLEADGLVLCEREGSVTVAVAMGEEPVPLPTGRILCSSAPLLPDGRLPADSVAWLQRDASRASATRPNQQPGEKLAPLTR